MPLVAPVYLPGQEPLPPGLSEEDRMQIMQSIKYQGYIVKTMESCVGKAAISGVLGFGLGAFFSLMSASLSVDDPLRQTMIDKAAAEKARKLEVEQEAAKRKDGASTAHKSTTSSHVNTTEAPPRNTTKQPIEFSNQKINASAPHTKTQSFLTKLPGGNYFKNLPAPPPQLPAATMQSTKEFFIQTGRSMYSSGRGFGKVGALYSGIECCLESYRAKNDIVNPVLGGFMAGGILARKTGPATALSSAMAFAAFSGAIDLFLRRETKDED